MVGQDGFHDFQGDFQVIIHNCFNYGIIIIIIIILYVLCCKRWRRQRSSSSFDKEFFTMNQSSNSSSSSSSSSSSRYPWVGSNKNNNRKLSFSPPLLTDKCVAKIKNVCVKGDVLYYLSTKLENEMNRKKFPRFWRGGANAPFKDAFSNLRWRGPFRKIVKLEVSDFASLKRDLPAVRGTTLYHYYDPVSHMHTKDDEDYRPKHRPPLNAAHAMWDILWLELVVVAFSSGFALNNIVYRDDFEKDDPVHGLCEIIRKTAFQNDIAPVHQDGCFDELIVVVASCDRHLTMLPAKLSAHILENVRVKIHDKFSSRESIEKNTVLLYGRTDTKQRKMLNVYDVFRELKSSLSINVTLWDDLILHKMISPAEQFFIVVNSWYVITPHGAFTCFWWPWLRRNATLHEIMGPCPKLHSDRNGRTYVNDEVAKLLEVKHLYRGGDNLWEKKVEREGMKDLSCKSHYTDPNFMTSPASVVRALQH